MNTIPPITDPLGKYWQQPDLSDVAIDDECALLTTAQLARLREYSSTIPSGVYPGKAWKAKSDGVWWLAWFGECSDPKKCSINSRLVLLVEA